MPINNTDKAIQIINNREKSLALYLFSTNKQIQGKVLEQISSGDVCFNDTLMHNIAPELPFGGVGTSGMSTYHSGAGFNIFSHKKSVFARSIFIDVPLCYAPFTAMKLKLAKWTL